MKNKKLIIRVILLLTGVFFFLILFGKLERQKQLITTVEKEETKSEKTESTNSTEQKEKIKENKTESVQEKQQEKVNETKPKSTTLTFVGDVLLSDGVLNRYDKEGIEGVLEKQAIEELSLADITIINNEFPFSNRGKQAEDKQFTFRIAPNRVEVLNKLGVDIASIANNHALDFGVDALVDTCETLKNAGIEYVGAGKNLEEAKEIRYQTVNGRTFAFIAASRVIPVVEWNASENKPGLLTTYDPANVLALIEEAKKQADTVIVYVHWGIERKDIPEDYQRNIGKMYIDAGADLVVGSHPHCLQGIEYYNGKPIVYSLGNFIFGTTIERTGILKVNVEKSGAMTLSILPCKANEFRTVQITDEGEIEEFYSYYKKISYGVSFQGKGEERTVVSTH